VTDKMTRLFLAVEPPPEVIDAVDDLPTRARRGVRYTKKAQWHITIRFLGDSILADALHALAIFEAPATTVTLGPEVSLLGERVVTANLRAIRTSTATSRWPD